MDLFESNLQSSAPHFRHSGVVTVGKGPLEGKYDLGFHFSAEWEDERCEAEKQEPVYGTLGTLLL